MADVVVGIDGSQASIEALRLAVREARLRGTSLRAVYVWHDDEDRARSLLAGTIDAVADETAGVEVEPLLCRSSSPAAALADAAAGAELLVLGTRGRGGLHELLDGSVSFDCRRRATCPVMVVTAPHKAVESAAHFQPVEVPASR
jgi:nucleotide-binding universal stress UspA family protein